MITDKARLILLDKYLIKAIKLLSRTSLSSSSSGGTYSIILEQLQHDIQNRLKTLGD